MVKIITDFLIHQILIHKLGNFKKIFFHKKKAN